MKLRWVWMGRVGLGLPMALAAASCGSSGGAGGGTAGAAGMAGSAGRPNQEPPPCASTYAACDCGEAGQGFLRCDQQNELTCNCEAPIPQGPLTRCAEPCGGDIVGDWYLKEVCGPTYAKGNCAHPVSETSGTPQPAGISFSASGQALGNLAYDATLSTQLTTLCSRQKGGRDVFESDCRNLETELRKGFQASDLLVVSNTCTYADDSCDCGSQVSAGTKLSGPYQTSGNKLTLGPSSLEYCVTGDKLSLRQNEASLSFTFERSRLSLPFSSPAVGAIAAQAVPATPGVTLGEGDCKSRVILNADTLQADCGASSMRVGETSVSGTKAIYVRSLSIPKDATLQIEGGQPVIFVADTIDIAGTVTFVSNSSTSGLGASSTDQAAGGGAHCTAGGKGGFWTGDIAANGGAAFGTQGLPTMGGKGGSATYSFNGQVVGVGGKGGGAVAFLAAKSINVTGSINVSGTAGSAGFGYGAGGGAGGSIVLEAPLVTVSETAKLSAVGGAGAGERGGAGATLSTAPGVDGGTNGASSQGGGGGGVGRIAIRTGGDPTKISELAFKPPLGACATVGTLAP